MSKRLRNTLIVIAALVLIIVFAVVNGRRHGSAVSVTVIKLTPTHFSASLPENGILGRPGVVTVPALVSGNLASLSVRAGDHVAAGQELATIDNPTLNANAASSQADYQSAVANIDTARVQEKNSRVQYEGAVATALSNLDEAKRIYQADASLYQQKAIARSQVDADKAKLDQAQVAYDQSVQQLKLGAVSGYGINSVSSAKSAADKAQIINNENQQQLGFTRILAPISGRILTVASTPNDTLAAIRVGDQVNAGQALFTIARDDGWIVRTKVDEQDVAHVTVGMRAQVSGEDLGGKKFTGRISSIAPTAQKSDDPSSTARQVITVVALDGSAPFFRDGMSVNVDIYTHDIANAIVVPISAIVTEKTKKYAWIVKSGIAHKHAVTTGIDNGANIVVTSGLKSGDEIIGKPEATLTDGAHVNAAAATPSPKPGST
ncbi:MAG: efflux RND transporter periplasmic adaptor subunit [Vulcanimicrobiaceae bacterium]